MAQRAEQRRLRSSGVDWSKMAGLAVSVLLDAVECRSAAATWCAAPRVSRVNPEDVRRYAS